MSELLRKIEKDLLYPRLALRRDNAFISSIHAATPCKVVSAGVKDACNLFHS